MAIILMVSAIAFSGSGSGTVIDPYMITTPAEFHEIGDDSAHRNAYYELANDLDFNVSPYNQPGVGWGGGYWNSDPPNDPIDIDEGCVDGKGHTIHNLYTNYSSEGLFYNLGVGNVALFGCTVKNLNFQSPRVYGQWNDAAVLGAGIYIYDTTFSNIHVYDGIISGDAYYVGGLVGEVQYLWDLSHRGIRPVHAERVQ